jgi:hypothetical protein
VGWARERRVRGLGGVVSRVRPRRAICQDCRRTHVLLPVMCLSRRADETGVIGMALELKAAGSGHRNIAGVLDRPPASTVRGWLRAFAGAAERVRQAFTALAAGLVSDPPLKREKPGRIAAQVERVLRAHCGWSPSVRTLQRNFGRLELATRPDGRPPAVFGRFEAPGPTSYGPGTRCTARTWRAARRSCSPSSMIIPGR